MSRARHIILTLLTLIIATNISANHPKENTEQKLLRLGYVDIRTLDPTIMVDLMYAKKDNFTHSILYHDLKKAFLHKDAAAALAQAQKILRHKHPGLSLKIYDAARPMTVQKDMWDKVKNTDKYFYVSNPARGGGLHNYGLAVDITLADAKGDTLDMGTPIDYMGKSSHIDNEQALLAQKKISPQALQNRKILRSVMTQAGFKPLRTEWWHFNFKSRQEAKTSYRVIP